MKGIPTHYCKECGIKLNDLNLIYSNWGEYYCDKCYDELQNKTNRLYYSPKQQSKQGGLFKVGKIKINYVKTINGWEKYTEWCTLPDSRCNYDDAILVYADDENPEIKIEYEDNKNKDDSNTSISPFTFDITHLMDYTNGIKLEFDTEANWDLTNIQHESSTSKFNLTPKQIKTHLDQHVIGQEDAKIALSVAVFNHYNRINQEIDDDIEIEKSNILMMGNSGCGKTLLAKTIAKILDVPFVSTDATSYTPAGYVGKDIEDIVKELIEKANGDRSKAEQGIVYIDEFDKLATGNANSGTQTRGARLSGDTQPAFLKLIEGSEVSNTTNTWGGSSKTINTQNVLFICGGAFSGMNEIIQSKLQSERGSIGFGSDIKPKVTNDDFEYNWDEVTHKEVIKYGIMPELAGRLPVMLKLKPLTEDDLVRILTEPKNAIIKQYVKLMNLAGIDVEFNKESLRAIAKIAIENGTGARGLRAVVDKIATKIIYHLPEDECKRVCTITADNIEHDTIPELNKMLG